MRIFIKNPRHGRSILVAGLVAALLAVMPSGLAWGKPENGKVFADWTVRCAVPIGESASRCAASQTLVVAESNTRLLMAEIGQNDKGIPTVAVLLPLGIDIPTGVSLVYETGTVEAIPVIRCVPDGCLALASLGGRQVADLKKGRQVKIRVWLPGTPQAVEIPMSLNGLAAAIDSLAQ